MARSRGYNNYRGRRSKGKIALAVLLILIILAAVVVILLQKYIVYDEGGTPRLETPWREEPTPYHVWVSEIMLQQTRVEAVRGYYDRFLARVSCGFAAVCQADFLLPAVPCEPHDRKMRIIVTPQQVLRFEDV